MPPPTTHQPQPNTTPAASVETSPLLRVAICGTPRSGKSALVALLQHATTTDALDTAGHSEELAQHDFLTPYRRLIMLDTPSQPKQMRLVAEACSTADAVVVVVSASTGLDLCACQHLQLAAAFRVPHLVVAINGGDDAAASTKALIETIEKFIAPLEFSSVTLIPLSTACETNITPPTLGALPYARQTLLACLESLEITPPSSDRFSFPVDARLTSDSATLLAGTAMEGSAKPGDMLRLGRTGATARLERVVTADGDLPCATSGQAVALLTAPVLEAQRGDILARADQPLETSDQFEATIVWMSDNHGLAGRTYELRLANQWSKACITTIRSRLNATTHTHDAARSLELNDIGIVRIATETPIVFDHYSRSRKLGGFILVDLQSRLAVATGMIIHNLRRAQNVHRQALSITRSEREKRNGHKGKVVWFTGLSGSGKSTLANALEVALHTDGRHTYLLDGDNVRHGLNKDLGFTDADRVENIRRIAEVAKLMMDAGLIVLTAFISPFRREREMARVLIGADNFVEIFVSTPLKICEERDPKGLYKKARSGQLPNMTGIGSPYEAPENPSITIDASAIEIPDAVTQIRAALDSTDL